jgi:hypothetical protein
MARRYETLERCIFLFCCVLETVDVDDRRGIRFRVEVVVLSTKTKFFPRTSCVDSASSPKKLEELMGEKKINQQSCIKCFIYMAIKHCAAIQE